MNRIDWFTQSPTYREQPEPVVFEWKIFPGHTTLKLFREVQNMVEKDHIQPEDFKDRIIFMSMYNDIVWGQKGNENICK